MSGLYTTRPKQQNGFCEGEIIDYSAGVGKFTGIKYQITFPVPAYEMVYVLDEVIKVLTEIRECYLPRKEKS